MQKVEMSTSELSRGHHLAIPQNVLRGYMSGAKTINRAFVTENGRLVLDINEFSSSLIQSIARKKRSNSSKLLRKKYNVGVVEWRLICGLAKEPGIPGSQLSRFSQTDKGLVSKGLTSLEKKGLIEIMPNRNRSLRVEYHLTRQGYELHDGFLPILLERETAIFSDSSEEEIEQFFVMLKRISRNLDKFTNEKFGTGIDTMD